VIYDVDQDQAEAGLRDGHWYEVQRKSIVRNYVFGSVSVLNEEKGGEQPFDEGKAMGLI
jgi:hypothetical protein